MYDQTTHHRAGRLDSCEKPPVGTRTLARLPLRRESTRELEHARELLLQIERVMSSGTLDEKVAHDLKNFVSIIRGYASLAHQAMAEGMPLDRGDMAAIRLASRRAWTLTNEVLASELDDSLFSILDVGQTVGALVPMLRTVAPSSISLEFEEPVKTLLVRGMPVHLDRILINLVLNARDAIQGQGVIRLSTREGSFHNGNPAALIQVADTGLGMSQSTLERIGEPYFTTKGHGLGVGLGLASAKTLLCGMRGLLQVESRIGHGSTFTVLLPIVPEALP